MLIVVRGEVTVAGVSAITLKQGQAIHLKGEDVCYAENRTGSEAVPSDAIPARLFFTTR